MKTIRIILALGLMLLCMSACSISARVKRADKRFAIGEYYEAGEQYRQLYRKISSKDKPLRAYVAFQQGECNRILNNKKATAAYKNAVRNFYFHTDSIVYLRYAQALHYQGKYKEAIKQYDIYLNTYPDNYVAQAGKFSCMQMEEWKKQKSRYVVTPVKAFNAKRSSNFSPALSNSDGDAIVFTSNRSENKDKKGKSKVRVSPVTGVAPFNLYSARKNAAGQWEDIALCEGLYNDEPSEGEEEAVGKQTNTAELGACSFSPDGRTMYFTYSKPVNGQDLGAKIYSSQRASGEWSEGQEVKLFSDSSITVGHPTINATGDTMYFVSDAPGGYGGKDIYMAISDGSEWSDIRNIGPKINTSDDELYPYIRPNGQLYFSSKGHPGYGGLDLYYAIPKDTTWEIYNMGTPFNTPNDDFGICFVGNTEDGYFSSNRNQKKGYDLIYSFVLPKMEVLAEGTVSNDAGEALSEGIIRLVGDDGTNIKTQIRKDGSYKLKLNKGVRYLMLATSRGYLNQQLQFTTVGLEDSYTYKQDFTLSSIAKPVKMGNIFFKFGSWELTPDSEDGLNALVKLLNDNPNITIEMAAHTDMVGNNVANQELSLRRAQSVVDYLIKHGIDSERLTPVGYGEDKPVVVDGALHKQYPYLPKNQILDEAFISTLSADKQEVCNSLNRRTEFRVLKTTYNLY